MGIFTDDFDEFAFFDNPRVRRIMREEESKSDRWRKRRMFPPVDDSDEDFEDDFDYQDEYDSDEFDRHSDYE